MTPADNKVLVARFVAAVNERRLDELDALLADDFSIPPNTPNGLNRGALKAVLQYYFSAFPDLHYDIEQQVAEGDTLFVHLKMQGTHQGDYQGHPATNKRFVVDEVEIMSIHGGKIAGYHIVWDELGFRRQLGIA
jgi:steroid delta-isomerase-like uncharacterized protein